VSAKLTFSGVQEMQAELQQLAPALTAYAQGRAVFWAGESAREIRRRYPSWLSGRLAAGVQVVATAGGGTRAGATVVQNQQPLGNYYEYGTKKIRRTKTGAKRGRMPKHAIFASTSPRMRALFVAEVRAHLAALGFTVTGDAGR
jgi:hypothetical protein